MSRSLPNTLSVLTIGLIVLAAQAKGQNLLNLFDADIGAIDVVVGSICNTSGYADVGECAVDVLSSILNCNEWYNSTQDFRKCVLSDYPGANTTSEVANTTLWFWYGLRVLHPNATISNAVTSGFLCSLLSEEPLLTNGSTWEDENSSIIITSVDTNHEYHVCDNITGELHDCFLANEGSVIEFGSCINASLNLTVSLSLGEWQTLYDVTEVEFYGTNSKDLLVNALGLLGAAAQDLCGSGEGSWGSICALFVRSAAIECEVDLSTTLGYAYESCLAEAEGSHDEHVDDGTNDHEHTPEPVVPFDEDSKSSYLIIAPLMSIGYALMAVGAW